MYGASTKERALFLMDQFAEMSGQNYPRAVECLLKDKESLLTYYSYPRQYWVSIKTTNPIESIITCSEASHQRCQTNLIAPFGPVSCL